MKADIKSAIVRLMRLAMVVVVVSVSGSILSLCQSWGMLGLFRLRIFLQSRK